MFDLIIDGHLIGSRIPFEDQMVLYMQKERGQERGAELDALHRQMPSWLGAIERDKLVQRAQTDARPPRDIDMFSLLSILLCISSLATVGRGVTGDKNQVNSLGYIYLSNSYGGSETYWDHLQCTDEANVPSFSLSQVYLNLLLSSLPPSLLFPSGGMNLSLRTRQSCARVVWCRRRLMEMMSIKAACRWRVMHMMTTLEC